MHEYTHPFPTHHTETDKPVVDTVLLKQKEGYHAHAMVLIFRMFWNSVFFALFAILLYYCIFADYRILFVLSIVNECSTEARDT